MQQVNGVAPEVPVGGDGFVEVLARNDADAGRVELLFTPVLVAHDAGADEWHSAVAVARAHSVAYCPAMALPAGVLIHLPAHLVLLVRLALLL